MSKIVAEKVCSISGHCIQALVTEEEYAVELKSMVPKREVFCVKCGKSRDEILKEKEKPAGRKTKPEKTEAIDTIS